MTVFTYSACPFVPVLAPPPAESTPRILLLTLKGTEPRLKMSTPGSCKHVNVVDPTLVISNNASVLVPPALPVARTSLGLMPDAKKSLPLSRLMEP